MEFVGNVNIDVAHKSPALFVFYYIINRRGDYRGDRIAGSYKTGIIYGGLSAGIAMFIHVTLFLFYKRNN